MGTKIGLIKLIYFVIFCAGCRLTFALELQRHNSKQLEMSTSSLASNSAGVDVDLDDRHEMQRDVTPGESDGRKPSCPFTLRRK